jgi:hypothetical protein
VVEGVKKLLKQQVALVKLVESWNVLSAAAIRLVL